MGLFGKLKEKLAGAASVVAEKFSIDRLRDGLEKTRAVLTNTLQSLVRGRKIDRALLDEIEELLLRADVGVVTTDRILGAVQKAASKAGITEGEKVLELIENEIAEILIESPSASDDAAFRVDASHKPHVIMVVGVNGVGKTTTIGKLAHNYKQTGKSVIIGAADTFRAAANEQLEVWAQQIGRAHV